MDNIKDIVTNRKPQAVLVLERGWKNRGYVSISNKILYNTKLEPVAKLLYWYLLTRCFQKKDCFPSLDIIHKDLGITPKTIIKYKKSLIEAKLIKVTRRGWGKTDVYTLKF